MRWEKAEVAPAKKENQQNDYGDDEQATELRSALA